MTDYFKRTEKKLQRIMETREATVLAFETSCDDTSVAVVKNGREVLSNVTASQIAIHNMYGGVVPEVASRKHIESISVVAKGALAEAGVGFGDIDAVVSTYGPGLVGAVLVGLNAAKGVALSLDVPFVGVNHMRGHIAANYISNKELEPPFLCLVVSGGHSQLIRVDSYSEFTQIACTRDDAAGEAFDKISRELGLGYPGGIHIQKMGEGGNERAYTFTRPKMKGNQLDFSFSGLKTAVMNIIRSEKNMTQEIMRDICASFNRTVVEMLVDNTFEALDELNSQGKSYSLAVAGGVAANKMLRDALISRSAKKGIPFYSPEIKYCTDNASMIGCEGYYKLIRGERDDLTLNAIPYLEI